MAETNAPVETDNIKKKALTRLAMAGGITLAALAGLWWLDRSSQDAPAPKPPTPAPIVSAREPAVEPPPAAEPPPPDSEALAASPTTPMQAPPPPQAGGYGMRPRPEAAPVEPSPAQATAKPILANAEAPAGRGFVVQLGVFTDPANAQELVARLNKQGIRAYTETRVHVGPFLNRAEADKARTELRRLGISGVVGATK